MGKLPPRGPLVEEFPRARIRPSPTGPRGPPSGMGPAFPPPTRKKSDRKMRLLIFGRQIAPGLPAFYRSPGDFFPKASPGPPAGKVPQGTIFTGGMVFFPSGGRGPGIRKPAQGGPPRPGVSGCEHRNPGPPTGARGWNLRGQFCPNEKMGFRSPTLAQRILEIPVSAQSTRGRSLCPETFPLFRTSTALFSFRWRGFGKKKPGNLPRNGSPAQMGPGGAAFPDALFAPPPNLPMTRILIPGREEKSSPQSLPTQPPLGGGDPIRFSALANGPQKLPLGFFLSSAPELIRQKVPVWSRFFHVKAFLLDGFETRGWVRSFRGRHITE